MSARASAVDVRTSALGARFVVKAKPRARRVGIGGLWNGSVRVLVREPAEGGRANAAVLAVLADALGVRVASLRLVAGAASSRKVVEAEGLSVAALRRRLAEALAPVAET